jgi:site-specific DNA-cytosine methylase
LKKAYKILQTHENQIINFKDYGANSSRTRSVTIGVRRDLIDKVHPLDLFPDKEEPKTLIEVIGNLFSLNEMGEIDPSDIYHHFKPYREDMRAWIHDISEGESAFDNEDINKRPHKIVDGEIVVHNNKHGDKYTRQCWDKVGPCVHTYMANLASQNTVHPVDDRAFSIRELLLMNIPNNFKWSEISE